MRRVCKIICASAIVSVCWLTACPAERNRKSSLPVPTHCDRTDTSCWADPSVLYVNRIFPYTHRSGLVVLEEFVKGNCRPRPLSGPPMPFHDHVFYRFSKCQPAQRRLVLRELRTGKLSRVVASRIPQHELVGDMVGERYVTLVPEATVSRRRRFLRWPPIHQVGADRDIEVKNIRAGRIWERGALRREVAAKAGEQITCFKLIPGGDLFLVCSIEGRYSNAQVFPPVDADQYAHGVPYDLKRGATGWVRLYSINHTKPLGEQRYAYTPVLRERGPCIVPPMNVPQGLFSAIRSKDDHQRVDRCERYYQHCLEPTIPNERCTKEVYRDILPRNFFIDAEVSPTGAQVAVNAFDDLYVYSIASSPPALSEIARRESASYRSRDWHVMLTALRWSSGGRSLLLFGRGRLLRIFSAPKFEARDFLVRAPRRCGAPTCSAMVSSATLDDQSQLLVYSRPDMGIGINWMNWTGTFDLGHDLRTIDGNRLYADVPISWSRGDFGEFPQDIIVDDGKVMFTASGIVIRLDLATGRPEGYMGYSVEE